MKRYQNFLAAFSTVFGLLFATVLGTADYFTPDSYLVEEGSGVNWQNNLFSVVKKGSSEVSADTRDSKTYRAELMLYRTVPVKSVQVEEVKNASVTLGGMPFGIKMFTNGIMVVGLADIKTETGCFNPATEAGLKVGDIITSVNGKSACSNLDVEKIVEGSGGRPIQFTADRGGQKVSASVQPVRDESDGEYKVGLWVRDSTAGIGTMTFYDPAEKCFAGLGHGICDSDTGRLMPLLSGDIVPVTISGVTKGVKGTPGELRGYFTDDKAAGTLGANVPSGVYGTLNGSASGQTVQVAMKQDVQAGPVKIYTTIDGNTPKFYDAVIERIDYRDSVQSKNLVLHVTDPQLLTQTGGIVQGMSGSPILQNGKLVGAVTHVFINDPTRGYGIFAEKMLVQSQSVGAQEKKLAS